ncbi:MAG TPA: zinc-ribbon domain-containing protein [Ktedonobacteraceae bacterium]
MADFLESAKSMVNAAVSRTSWEAQKQMRVRSKQTEIEKLLDQRQHLLDELGQIAMNLYQQGKLTDQQLSRLCASIQELDHDVENRETQLQEIKSEAYQANQFAPASTPDYTPPVSSSTPSASQTSKAGGKSLLCPVCGTTLRPNALYCRSCGTKLR